MAVAPRRPFARRAKGRLDANMSVLLIRLDTPRGILILMEYVDKSVLCGLSALSVLVSRLLGLVTLGVVSVALPRPSRKWCRRHYGGRARSGRCGLRVRWCCSRPYARARWRHKHQGDWSLSPSVQGDRVPGWAGARQRSMTVKPWRACDAVARQSSQAQAQLRNAQAQLDRTRDLQSEGWRRRTWISPRRRQKTPRPPKEQANAGAVQSGLAQGFTRVTAPFGWLGSPGTHAEAGDSWRCPANLLQQSMLPQPLRVVVQVPSSRSALARRRDANARSRWAMLRQPPHGSVPDAIGCSLRRSHFTNHRVALWSFSAQDALHLVPGQQAHVRFVQSQGAGIPSLPVPARRCGSAW